MLLVGLNARLFVAMHRAQAQHRRLLRENLQTESRRLAETNMATLMLLVVVGVFLVVEVPLAVMMMMMIVENTSESLQLMDPSVRRTATLLINVIIQFSYPVNFFIYCGMSQQFRQTFCRLFVDQAAATVMAAPTQPSRFVDVDDEVQNDDGGDVELVHGDRDPVTALSVEQVNVSNKVDQNGGIELMNKSTSTDEQHQT